MAGASLVRLPTGHAHRRPIGFVLGHRIDERVERPDNHWLDCLVGCAVAGSMLGAKLASEGPVKPVRKRYTLEEMRQMADRPSAQDLARQRLPRQIY